MKKILASGLINIETTLKVEGFPIAYAPVRYPFFGAKSTLSGVGLNVAKALLALGDEIHFLSLIGQDFLGQSVSSSLRAEGIPVEGILALMEQTPQSVILYDQSGQRQINVDLKSIQETAYPQEVFEAALADCDLAILCNINFSRPFLASARRAGVLIATDIHVIGDVEDAYNRDFMAQAHILFMSDEGLPCSPEEWAQRLQNCYGTEFIVIGLGKAGALLAVKEDYFMQRFRAVFTRPVVNTIGAGDALFSAFVHFYRETHDPYSSLRRAIVFASYKIGEDGGANGFLSEAALNRLVEETS